MAIVALVAGGHMIQRFAGSLGTVVAAYATAGYGGVVHKSDRTPARGDMTIRTFARRRHVIGRLCGRSDEPAL